MVRIELGKRWKKEIEGGICPWRPPRQIVEEGRTLTDFGEEFLMAPRSFFALPRRKGLSL